MSDVSSALIAAALEAGLEGHAGRFLRRKFITESGATLDNDNQVYRKGDKVISIEMALFGPLERLGEFLRESNEN